MKVIPVIMPLMHAGMFFEVEQKRTDLQLGH